MQAAAIMALKRDGPVSQADLGRAIGMEPANVHGLVARLHKLRMIETMLHPSDQRQVRIALSVVGDRNAERIAAASSASAEATLAPLTPDERRSLLALLSRIAS